ncbi:uncharacterized protein EV420DRAFT_1266632 [Desarmillaria tabescens]|uniref:CxC2-like cysteine cluster KDZ transposase-associated domain-containing protein n=1 Tax=Armillaria tabescens TaxID=1929756 RepID=A0AA39TRR9_ARMTA|nr:uncharacterized protein EV420DRAFT_1266632 [Desarmillaria tabescens]KAK0461669.1 hypothetical protein EV420DRAFT_1266632 [Desarmillaria tabescens]
MLKIDNTVVAAMVRHGLLPCAPYTPRVVITIKTMETFHLCHLQCPQFSVQAFVRALCDLHQSPCHSHLQEQFRICYDVYIEILCQVDQRVMNALSRDEPDWRLRNCYPACTFTVKDEPALEFKMLLAIDGNNLLRRLSENSTESASEEMGDSFAMNHTEPARRARIDLREVSGWGNYYVSRAHVEEFSKEAIGEILTTDTDPENPMEPSPCTERWANMVNDLTSRMWGIYDETGIFLSVCRHGFVLLVADMIKSGELAKYPLAIIDKLIDVLGDKLGVGYDVGCKFGTTINRSPIGPKARLHHYRSLVGLFHGHAHNRRCQLCNLGTYILGMGLEDLETCERWFSKSNSLASSTRHMSAYHRRLAIIMYMHHVDRNDAYENLSKFLCSNYKQALKIIKEIPALVQTMDVLGIESQSEFDKWLQEEKEYLNGLTKEPEFETCAMEYYSQLVEFYMLEAKLAKTRVEHSDIITPETFTQSRDKTSRKETARRHLIEKTRKQLQNVQHMELLLNIGGEHERWAPGMAAWESAQTLVRTRDYRRCLNNLEALVVSRIFELTKMNMSKTGKSYLILRSKTIQVALTKYNAAAKAMSPPRPPLQWDQVVEYAFLANFDLLRNAREDIIKKPWANPNGRAAMDGYFKLQRAYEEIDRLNVEIKRVVTFIRHEDIYLCQREQELSSTDPMLAFQIARYRQQWSRFDDLHMKRFSALSGEPGFTGSIVPGELSEPRSGFGNGIGFNDKSDKSIHRNKESVDEGESENDDGSEVDEEAIQIYTAIGE